MATVVSIKYGNEGPRYDPYSYVEITVIRNDAKPITGHFGLCMWIEVNNNHIEYPDSSEEYLTTLFTTLTGGRPEEWEKWLDRARSRCKNCGCRVLYTTNGYLGETLYCCKKCDNIVSSHLSHAAIE